MGNKSEFDSRNFQNEVQQCERRIRLHIRETPLEYSPLLSRESGSRVYLKLENQQKTGSFKIRGAANKILCLSPEQRQLGAIAASTGNHGHAVAHLTHHLRVPGTIFLPHNTSQEKIEVLKIYDRKLRFHGQDCVEAEAAARQAARELDQTYISPYNDLQVVTGQATVAWEIMRQAEDLEAVLVPVGGGGLASGMAAFLKQADPAITMIGCQPQNSRVMYESVRAGHIVEMESLPTLSDGTAGGLEPGSITFDICRRLLDDFVLLSEEEIGNALHLMLSTHHLLIEGAAALTVAALLKQAGRWRGKTVVLVLSGSKLSLDSLRKILRG